MDRPAKNRKRRLRTERETDDNEVSHRSATIIETSGSSDHENLVSGPVPDHLPESEQKTPLAEPGVTQRDLNIQRAIDGTGTSQEEVPDQVLAVIGDGGLPLDPSIRRSLEERMDADFSDVRIHTGPKAAKAADAIDARAFTCGNSIVFNDGEYEPESPEGQFLLAHELAHVKQQNGGAPLSMMPKPDAELEIDPDPQLEREADRAAEEALQGEEPLTINRLGSEVHIQRFPHDRTAEFYESVIDAIRQESDLDQEDIDRIKEEVAAGVPGTDYDGARGHDVLNVKILEKAREKAAEKAEQMDDADEFQEVLEDSDLWAKKGIAQDDIDRGISENGNIDDLTDGEESAMDVIHEYAKIERSHADTIEKLEELDQELRGVLSDENLRLTDAQEKELKALEQELAEQFGSGPAELAITYLLNVLTQTTTQTTLSGLFASLVGDAEASTVAAAVVMAISMGLALFAQAVTDYYDSDPGSGKGDSQGDELGK